jgi:zinc protease
MQTSKSSKPAPGTPVVHRLANGLRVLHRFRPGVGVVAVQAWVDVGSGDESADEEGLAHLHEHMLFKGTKAYAAGAIDAAVARLGGEINAWTSFDETVYHLVLPSASAPTGLTILAELLQRPRLSADDLGPELDVVLEEIRQDFDVPGRKVSQKLFEAAYGTGHPYGRDIAGSAAAVRRLNHTKLTRFFARHYRPERTLLAIDGDLEAAALEKLLTQGWAGWKSSGAAASAVQRGPAAPGSSIHFLRANADQAHFAMAFSAADLDPIGRADLALLAAVLGHGESSLLVRRLQYERQLVNGIFAYGFDPRGPGLLVIGASTDGDRLRGALDATIRTVLRAAAHGVSAGALERAKAQLLADAIFQSETVQDEASRLAYFESQQGSWRAEIEARAALSSATPERLRAFAARLIAEQRQHLVVLVPGGALPDLTKDGIAAISAGAWAAGNSELQIAQQLPKPDEAGRYSLTLPSGVRLVLEPKADAAVTAINATWIGGQLLENAGTAGLHALLAELVPQASERYSEVELAQRIDALGAAITALPGRSSFGLRGAVISEHFDAFFELFLDVLKRPKISDDAVDRERMRLLEVVRSRDERPAQRAYAESLKDLFGDHPYALPLEGEEEALRHLTAADLRSHYFRHYGERAPTIVVVGAFAPKSILQRLLTAFPAAALKATPLTLPPAATHRPTGSEPMRWIELKRSQVQVAQALPGLPIGDPKEAELMLLLEVLGSSSGVLFTALREQRGLTYGVHVGAIIGLSGGALTIHYSTAPERVTESLAVLENALATFLKTGPSAAALEQARRLLSGSRAVSRQTSGARCQEMALDRVYDFDIGRSDRLYQRLEAVTPEAVQALAKTLFGSGQVHTVLLGPKIEKPATAPALSLAGDGPS